MNDVKSFAIDWTIEDTNILLEEFSDHINNVNFFWLISKAHKRNESMSLSAIKWRLACIYIINCIRFPNDKKNFQFFGNRSSFIFYCFFSE